MYTFKNTEQTNQKASEYETKSLLYLLCMRKDSSEIDVFMIDCFNDITGGNNSLGKLWDVQSKGVKSLRPKTIGEALVTLFKNYKSKILFDQYILFIPKLKEGYLINEKLISYSMKNFKAKYHVKIKEGLIGEYSRRENVQIPTNSKSLRDFLKSVTFVVANKDKESYTRKIVNFKNKNFKDKQFFVELFDEIRDMQTALKNNCIEGLTISSLKEILELDKSIRKSELEIVTINRLVGIDVFNNRNVPIGFLDEINGRDKEDIRDIIQECNASLSRTLFNKNIKKIFWCFMEEVVRIVKKYPKEDCRKLYNLLPSNVVNPIYTLDEIGCIYFISLVQEGLYEN
jgi:hypothetical protein